MLESRFPISRREQCRIDQGETLAVEMPWPISIAIRYANVAQGGLFLGARNVFDVLSVRRGVQVDERFSF